MTYKKRFVFQSKKIVDWYSQDKSRSEVEIKELKKLGASDVQIELSDGETISINVLTESLNDLVNIAVEISLGTMSLFVDDNGVESEMFEMENFTFLEENDVIII